MTPRSFRTGTELRVWLEKNHAKREELLLRCFKVDAAELGLTYKQALDEALCFGWIDGVRRGLDEASFTVRFTPRRAKSKWSSVNTRRAKELEAEGRMHASGLAAFRARDPKVGPEYSFESRTREFSVALAKRFRASKAAWKYFQSRPPGYRRLVTFWVMSAKQDATRERRLAVLIESSARGSPIPGLERRPKKP
jgi:uncharacterized protein YdeI (YjbR/CyaY-like superfamily)